jgi:hypothetical protein
LDDQVVAMTDSPSDATPPTYVNHPLWSRFLRWCTIRPKPRGLTRTNSLVAAAYNSGEEERLSSLPEHEYTLLPDPLSFIRLATILPGEFDDEIRIRLDHHVLKPPSRAKPPRLTLAEIRRNMPEGWEAFQTVRRDRHPALHPGNNCPG